MTRMRTRSLLATFLTALLVALVGPAPAHAGGHVEVRVAFDESVGQFPEGVAVDRRGNVFVGLLPLGEIWKVPAGGGDATLFGSVAGLDPSELGGLAGLATDPVGNVYAAAISSNPEARGVWRFDRDTGAATRLPGTDDIPFPNGLAFDPRGNLYVTDTIDGRVWRIPPGGVAHVWIDDDILDGDGRVGFGFPIGANGIAIRHNTVIVGVSETQLLVNIPILPGGGAGTPTVHATSPVLIDGIAVDVLGNVYIASPLAGAIVRVAPDGSSETVATNADGLDNPTSVAFGTGRGDARTLFAVNISTGLGGPGAGGPSLTAVDVGVKGFPE